MTKLLTRVCFAVLSLCLVGGIAGCMREAPTSTPAPVFSENAVRSGLDELLGERFGRAQVHRGYVCAELTGEASDSDFAGTLLLLLPARSEGESLSVAFLDPSAKWNQVDVEWNPETGRVRRMRGDGAEFLVLPPRADGAVPAWAGTSVWDGGVASGVDAAAMGRYASGEPVPWDPSVR